jgi:hypothetical protein
MFKSLNSAKCASDHFVRIKHIKKFSKQCYRSFFFSIHEEIYPHSLQNNSVMLSLANTEFHSVQALPSNQVSSDHGSNP